MASSLKFGTSGLRGLVSELTDVVCRSYTAAFIGHLGRQGGLAAEPRLLVGRDLRASSPDIAAQCIAAAKAEGVAVENCGALPTPALALRSLTLGIPAIMVTGSHIPADRNGLKFYKAEGEIDKADEAGIVAGLGSDPPGAGQPAAGPAALPVDPAALDAYQARCRGLLAPAALAGMRIGVYQHSSVARDLMVAVLAELGAEVVPLARSEVFVPVDTEALRADDIAFGERAAAEHRLAALVSTDGDADRPLIADEAGRFLRGDTVGILAARFLDADAVATPVTSNTAVDASGFTRVCRCRVGSPYVIEQLGQAVRDGFRRVVGFEANGGVLLGSDVAGRGGPIGPLPTRDAMLPILAVLGSAAERGVTLSALVGELPARFTQSGRIEHVGAERSGPFLTGLRDTARADRFLAEHGTVASLAIRSTASASCSRPATSSTSALPAMRRSCAATPRQPRWGGPPTC